jgi:hypothetical protein
MARLVFGEDGPARFGECDWLAVQQSCGEPGLVVCPRRFVRNLRKHSFEIRQFGLVADL